MAAQNTAGISLLPRVTAQRLKTSVIGGERNEPTPRDHHRRHRLATTDVGGPGGAATQSSVFAALPPPGRCQHSQPRRPSAAGDSAFPLISQRKRPVFRRFRERLDKGN